MGLLVNGQWQDQWYATEKSKGRFVRSAAQFRNWVTVDGSAGPSGRQVLKPRLIVIIYMCLMPVPGQIAL